MPETPTPPTPEPALVKTVEKPATAFAPREKLSLVGLTRADLTRSLTFADVPERELRMRVSQLWNWIYVRGARDFDSMSNIARDLRKRLADTFTLERPEVAAEQVSRDGTRKWLLRMAPVDAFDKGAEIECVYIPEHDRGTLCVSSQVGCTMTCTFCHTGTQPWVRNLTAAEIAAQVIVARDTLGEWPGQTPPDGAIVPVSAGGRLISNVVYMGMGEPLFNLDNVVKSIDILSDAEGMALSRRRITVSTSGVAPQIVHLGELANPMLAVSL
ncbi:MAG: 23S rRNA (adenine(2503)-C(2))-methyltransferase RlmN, partial [Methylobacteriaceae bacterium]|nr:23S rRNA (adenine(2503)-C(2))-methyltransferase RlmN [Methylobacteriaceae bacterium]